MLQRSKFERLPSSFLERNVNNEILSSLWACTQMSQYWANSSECSFLVRMKTKAASKSPSHDSAIAALCLRTKSSLLKRPLHMAAWLAATMDTCSFQNILLRRPNRSIVRTCTHDTKRLNYFIRRIMPLPPPRTSAVQTHCSYIKTAPIMFIKCSQLAGCRHYSHNSATRSGSRSDKTSPFPHSHLLGAERLLVTLFEHFHVPQGQAPATELFTSRVIKFPKTKIPYQQERCLGRAAVATLQSLRTPRRSPYVPVAPSVQESPLRGLLRATPTVSDPLGENQVQHALSPRATSAEGSWAPTTPPPLPTRGPGARLADPAQTLQHSLHRQRIPTEALEATPWPLIPSVLPPATRAAGCTVQVCFPWPDSHIPIRHRRPLVPSALCSLFPVSYGRHRILTKTMHPTVPPLAHRLHTLLQQPSRAPPLTRRPLPP